MQKLEIDELAVERLVIGGHVVVEVEQDVGRRQLVFRDVHGGKVLGSYLLLASPEEAVADAERAAEQARRGEAARAVEGPAAHVRYSALTLERELTSGWWRGIREERAILAGHLKALRSALDQAPWLSETHTDLMARAQQLIETADKRLAEHGR